MYAKIFASILDSSVWLQPHHVVRVWLTLLASKNEDGYARFATIENLRARARVTTRECEEAVRELEAPDPESSSPEMEGRRIVRTEGGWTVVNAKLYDGLMTREHEKEMNRARVARHRSKSTGDNTSQLLPTTLKPKPEPTDPAFEALWRIYPRRSGGNPKAAALRQWKARVKWGTNPQAMHDGVVRYAKYIEATGKLGTEFVKQAATFLGPDFHFNEPFPLPETNGNGGKVNPGLQQMANILGREHD